MCVCVCEYYFFSIQLVYLPVTSLGQESAHSGKLNFIAYTHRIYKLL